MGNKMGNRTDASAADELSCSPSAVFGSGSLLGASTWSSVAYLLAERPGDFAPDGVFGEARDPLLV